MIDIDIVRSIIRTILVPKSSMIYKVLLKIKRTEVELWVKKRLEGSTCLIFTTLTVISVLPRYSPSQHFSQYLLINNIIYINQHIGEQSPLSKVSESSLSLARGRVVWRQLLDWRYAAWLSKPHRKSSLLLVFITYDIIFIIQHELS